MKILSEEFVKKFTRKITDEVDYIRISINFKVLLILMVPLISKLLDTLKNWITLF